jgi:hypothetical protein
LSSFAKWSEKNKEGVTLQTKMLMIGKMEEGVKCANFCSSLGLAPATVSTIMANADKNRTTSRYKIKQSSQIQNKTIITDTKSHASNASYTINFNTDKNSKLLALWVDD